MSGAGGREPDLPSLLVRLEDRIRDAGAGIVGLLAPGIPAEAVRSSLAELGMDPPEELVQWFAWHDGLTVESPRTTGEGSLGLWSPNSLQQSIDEWRALDRGTEPGQWLPTWLPIARVGGPDNLAVDCTPPQGPLATVRCAMPDAGWFDEEEVASVTGLSTVVGWWIEAIDNGWWIYDAARDHWMRNYGDIPAHIRRTFLV